MHPIHIGDTLRLHSGNPVYFISSKVNLIPDFQGNSVDNTFIHLLSADDDIILRLSVRRCDNAIVFNSHPSGQDWGAEELIDLEGVFRQTRTVIGFRLDGDTWVVEVDNHEVKMFRQRIDKPLAALRYDSDDRRKSVFADKCDVATSPPPLQYFSQLLAYDGKVEFSNPISNGDSIIFHSNSINLVPYYGAKIDDTNVNLLSADGDILLHLSVRRAENAIVLNSHPSGGSWGAEERIPLHGVFERTDATITVRLHSPTWDILVDGNPLKLYNSRIQKPATGVSYGGDDANALVFANPLLVMVSVGDSKSTPVTVGPSAHSYEQAYFPLTPAEVASDSKSQPFDYVIIGSGIGGGVLAADLHEKNKSLSCRYFKFQDSMAIRTKRILVIERGGLLFHTHSLNMPRPTNRGTYGQANDLFYNHFRVQYDMDEETREIWNGGAVYCLGGRSTVWGLFVPRISNDTFYKHFPADVCESLNNSYLQRAEKAMLLSFPQTHHLHRVITDKLNVQSSGLPTTRWEWGRIASQFSSNRNFDFAEGAYSTVDRLLEAGMDDSRGTGDGNFRTLVNSPVDHLVPAPDATNPTKVEYVVVKGSDGRTHEIKCKNVVIAAGAVDSPAIVLRSMEANQTLSQAFGDKFKDNFGHLTDHRLLYVTLPFFYRNPANQAIVGGMKLQTDITLSEDCAALANISLDASGFLPRRNVPDSQLPQFIIAYILPSELNGENSIELKDEKPFISVRRAQVPELEKKKEVLLKFSVDVMNKIAAALEIRFVKHERVPTPPKYPPETVQEAYIPLETVREEDIELGEAALGGVAHEMGSLPMPRWKVSEPMKDDDGGVAPQPTEDDDGGVLNSDLRMKYGWSNVYVCDLSVFPYSPAANPSLTLAALSLRLSDHLVPPKTHLQPIVVYNLLPQEVWVLMSTSRVNALDVNPGPDANKPFKIESGKSALWKRSTRETIQIFASEHSLKFNVQMVNPGINALIVEAPPTDWSPAWRAL